MKKSTIIRSLMTRLEDAVKIISHQEMEIMTLNKRIEEEEAKNEALVKHISELNEAHNCLHLMCEVQRESMKGVKNVEYSRIIQSKEDGRTIILWKDGTKSEIKCSKKDEFNPMTGIALGYLKKLLSPKMYRKIFINGKVEVIDRDKIHKEHEAAKKKKKGKKGE